jgi:hypothetical protein
MCWYVGNNTKGNNELDQVQKIHKILGTPPMQLLEKMKRQAFLCLGIYFLCKIMISKGMNFWFVLSKIKWHNLIIQNGT